MPVFYVCINVRNGDLGSKECSWTKIYAAWCTYL